MPTLTYERDPRISIDLEVRVWYDEGQDSIHIAGSGLHTHVNNNPESKRRYHPKMFEQLRRLLKKADKPAPDQ